MLANASIQNTTTPQGLLCAAFGGFPPYVVASSCPTAGSLRRDDMLAWPLAMQQLFRRVAIGQCNNALLECDIIRPVLIWKMTAATRRGRELLWVPSLGNRSGFSSSVT